jgi:hypothetical protein
MTREGSPASGQREPRRRDALRPSNAPPDAETVDNSAGRYPTEAWEATYFSVSPRGKLTARRVTLRVPAGLAGVCPQVHIGKLGCVYAVRRWGFALRPSALEAAGFDTRPVVTAGDDAHALREMLHAAAFDLPGEFVIASPEHPFRLVAPDGTLRGSSMQWRTYLGALTFFVSGGEIDADFLRLWVEAEDVYRQAVDLCLTILQAADDDT